MVRVFHQHSPYVPDMLIRCVTLGTMFSIYLVLWHGRSQGQPQ